MAPQNPIQPGREGSAIASSVNQDSTRFPVFVTSMIAGILLLIVVIHIGFYNTYIKFFPKFQDSNVDGYGPVSFNAVKHFHGMTMMGWIFMLLLQPILIRAGKMTLHRWVGRLSYVLAPVVMVSIFLMNRHAYHNVLSNMDQTQAIAVLALVFPFLVYFTILYSLAILYRHRPELHMRFMCSTAFLFLSPALDRALIYYFALPGYDVGSLIELSLIAIIVVIDSIKTKRLSPFTLVFVLELLHVTLWHARESAAWQAIGGVIANLF